MALKMVHALVASVLVVALASTVQACSPLCPPNYYPVISDVASCGYACATQYKPECLPQPTFNYRTRQWQAPAPATQTQYEAAMPRVCGGSDLNANVCPAIACAYSASYAISGPLGCATAGSYVSTTAVSNTTYNFKQFFKESIQAYTTDLCSYGYSAANLTAFASGVSTAFAKAVAQTFTHYNTYVCSCCYNNNAAQTTVGAAVQAVATAIADAWAEADAAVYDCNGNPISLATASTEAVAMDVQLAIDSVYQTYFSYVGNNCGPGCYNDVQTACAKTAACAFVSTFARAVDSVTQGTTSACASTFTVSGSEPDCLFTASCAAQC